MEATTINFQPLKEWVVIKETDTSKTEAGIILESPSKKKDLTGVYHKVMATGGNVTDVVPGDMVLLQTCNIIEIEIDKEVYVMLQSYHVIARLPRS